MSCKLLTPIILVQQQLLVVNTHKFLINMSYYFLTTFYTLQVLYCIFTHYDY
jgi:hypothetical protein